MSREIKFRVWDKQLKRYATENDELYLDISGDLSTVILTKLKEVKLRLVDTVTQMLDGNGQYVIEQYTGLKDKNGVEIYEGDIVKAEVNGNCVVLWDEKQARFMVVAENLTWGLNGWASVDNLEVIGNVHENPELLDSWSQESKLLNLRNSTELEGKVVGYALVNQDTGETIAKVGEINTSERNNNGLSKNK